MRLQSCSYTAKAPLGKLESKAGHTTPVFIDGRSAVLLGVFRSAEEHAFVSGSLFVFAYTAGLFMEKSAMLFDEVECIAYLGFGSGWVGGLEIYSRACPGGSSCEM